MSDHKHINEFRKGTILRKISEDPTYLSFFIMFDSVDREHSPLLSGRAEEYLKKFVDGDKKTGHAAALHNFKKVLLKINKDMPWFWQKISGLELTQTYGKMQEPWRGAENPKIDIECLEENVELTAISLMMLYRKAVYDYQRYIEILPKNLRHFRVWIVMSEVRTFQQDTAARNLNLYKTPMPDNIAGPDIKLIPRAGGSETSEGANGKQQPRALHTNYNAESKPYMMFELDFCEWITDSIADMFTDASKMPELKKPKISFSWQHSHISGSKFGPNITEDEKVDLMPKKPEDGLYPNTPFNPLANAQNAISDKVNGLASSLVNRFNNLKNSLPGQGNNPLGRVYPEGLTGAAATIANAGMDKVKSLILDNVHGAGTGLGSLGDINSALEAGSINGIANLAGQLFKTKSKKPVKGNITPEKIYEPGIDSSPDNKLNDRVYDPIQQATDQPISPSRIYDPGVDSTPDNNINDNAHS